MLFLSSRISGKCYKTLMVYQLNPLHTSPSKLSCVTANDPNTKYYISTLTMVNKQRCTHKVAQTHMAYHMGTCLCEKYKLKANFSRVLIIILRSSG